MRVWKGQSTKQKAQKNTNCQNGRLAGKDWNGFLFVCFCLSAQFIFCSTERPTRYPSFYPFAYLPSTFLSLKEKQRRRCFLFSVDFLDPSYIPRIFSVPLCLWRFKHSGNWNIYINSSSSCIYAWVVPFIPFGYTWIIIYYIEAIVRLFVLLTWIAFGKI